MADVAAEPEVEDEDVDIEEEEDEPVVFKHHAMFPRDDDGPETRDIVWIQLLRMLPDGTVRLRPRSALCRSRPLLRPCPLRSRARPPRPCRSHLPRVRLRPPCRSTRPLRFSRTTRSSCSSRRSCGAIRARVFGSPNCSAMHQPRLPRQSPHRRSIRRRRSEGRAPEPLRRLRSLRLRTRQGRRIQRDRIHHRRKSRSRRRPRRRRPHRRPWRRSPEEARERSLWQAWRRPSWRQAKLVQSRSPFHSPSRRRRRKRRRSFPTT